MEYVPEAVWLLLRRERGRSFLETISWPPGTGTQERRAMVPDTRRLVLINFAPVWLLFY